MVWMNEQQIPFVDPPPKWIGSVAIEHEPGTRKWLERGTTGNFKHWIRELQDWLPGDLIPLSWVPEYVGVTRGAVKKRIETQRLTVFTYIVSNLQKTRSGTFQYRETRTKFEFTAMTECDAWIDEIIERRGPEEHDKPRKHKRRK